MTELKPLAEENCAGCGKPMNIEPGVTWMASVDGRVWHSGCSPSTRSLPTAPADVERVEEANELIAILDNRQSEDFDGECHLTDAEADRLITFIRRSAIAAHPVSGLREALQVCANKFWEYVIIHQDKHTPEGDEKAASNREMAEMCEAALAPVEPISPIVEVSERLIAELRRYATGNDHDEYGRGWNCAMEEAEAIVRRLSATTTAPTAGQQEITGAIGRLRKDLERPGGLGPQVVSREEAVVEKADLRAVLNAAALAATTKPEPSEDEFNLIARAHAFLSETSYTHSELVPDDLQKWAKLHNDLGHWLANLPIAATTKPQEGPSEAVCPGCGGKALWMHNHPCPTLKAAMRSAASQGGEK